MNDPKITIITTTGTLTDLIHYMVDYIDNRHPPHVFYEHIITNCTTNEYIRKSLEPLNSEKRKVINFDEDPGFPVNFKKVFDQIRGDIIINIDADVLVTHSNFWKFIVDTLNENPYTLIGRETSAWIAKYKLGNIVGGPVMAWTRKALESGIFPDQNLIGFGVWDVDLSLQFLEKGYPLKSLTDFCFHLGGTMSGFFYAITPEYFTKNSQENHDYFFQKWDKKIPTLKGWL